MSDMTDRVFDRVPSKPDPVRLDRFNIAASIVDMQPRSYTWAVGQVLDQGREGACVGHGWAHEAIARPVVVPFPHIAPNGGQVYADPQRFAFELYRWAQQNDEWAGEAYEGTSVAAGAKGMAAVGMLGEYRWTRNADDLAVAVSRKGPAVIGVDWFSRMFDTDSQGYIHAEGTVQGGHCVLVNGYNVARRAFKLTNSWGDGWGRGGAAWLAHDDMNHLLGSGGEACVPMRRTV
jgi:Papain family cysteine protease